MYSLTHVRLLVSNFAECLRFYRDVMGFELVWGEEDGIYADLRVGSMMVSLFERQLMAESLGCGALPQTAVSETQDQVALILSVENVDTAVANLKQHHVQLISEAQDRKEWGIRLAHFRDPAGHLIEINQPLNE